MAVNESVYGATNLWVPCYYQQSGLSNKNKKAWFGGSTAQTQLRTGVSEGKLSYSEPIDKTLAYCGFGTESALSHRAYIGKDPENTGYLKIYEYQDSSVSNWAFFEKTAEYGSTNNPQDAGYIRLDDLGRTAWNNSINNDWNYSNYLEPYVFVNPHNMVLLINVTVGTTLNNTITIDLDTYINNRASYPYLYTVYGNLYFGQVTGSTERNVYAGKGTYPPGWKTTTLQCLDNYKCNEKNIDLPMYGISYSGSCILMGNPARISTMYNDNDFLNIFYTTEAGKEHIKLQRIDNSLSYAYIEYYEGLIDDILKTAACFGLYFTTKQSVAINGILTNNDMYIGILDSLGVGHGEYLRGAQTANAPQADPNFIDMHTVNYDPYPDDPTKYRNDTQFYAGYGTSSFTKFYALTEAQVNTLSQELYRIANDVPAGTSITEYNMKVFLTNNPIDCVISLKKFPVANIPLATSDATIYLGSKATSITGKILATPTWVYYFNFRNSSGTSCRPVFGDNFLDYEPYTKCKIVIPFCGTVDIPVSYIYQYDDLQIALVIDFITGAVTAYVLVNGITIDSITGACAIDLPVSGIQSATLDSQIHSVAMAREKQQTSLNTGLIAGAVSIGVGIATGSLPIAIGGGAAIIGSFMHATDTGKQINYELSHMDTPIKQVSAASGQITHTYDMRCKMIITRPTIADEYSAEEYAQTIGFACLDNGSVKDYHGFTVANIDISGIDATAEEKEMIKTAFATGVYLPESWE